MARHGHLDGRAFQPPGLMQHGSFPVVGFRGRRPLEPSSTWEMMEIQVEQQAREIEKLIRENQRLAASHVTLRQDIFNAEKEMQMIRVDLDDAQEESDMQMRDLVESIKVMEADIHSGDMLKKELQQAHMEAKGLVAARQELTAELQHLTEELQKISEDNKSIAEMHAELDGLRQEHQHLRSAFEYEKNTNVKQVEQMETLETNLITMASAADRLRSEVGNAEKRAQAAAQAMAAQAAAMIQPGTTKATAMSTGTNPFWSSFTSLPATYEQATQAGRYAYAMTSEDAIAYQHAYQHAVQASGYAGYTGYPAAFYYQNTLASYHDAHAASQHPSNSETPTDVANAATSTGFPAGLVQTSGGAATPGQSADPYSSMTAL